MKIQFIIHTHTHIHTPSHSLSSSPSHMSYSPSLLPYSHVRFRPKLVEYIHRRKLNKAKAELALCEQYDKQMAEWERRVEKAETSNKKRWVWNIYLIHLTSCTWKFGWLIFHNQSRTYGKPSQYLVGHTYNNIPETQIFLPLILLTSVRFQLPHFKLSLMYMSVYVFLCWLNPCLNVTALSRKTPLCVHVGRWSIRLWCG